MAKKPEMKIEPPVAKPVIAVEYDGTLYPSFQKAEGARALSEILPLLSPPRQCDGFREYDMFTQGGERAAATRVLDNAERIHGILSRYLDAAKIEMPRNAP